MGDHLIVAVKHERFAANVARGIVEESRQFDAAYGRAEYAQVAGAAPHRVADVDQGLARGFGVNHIAPVECLPRPRLVERRAQHRQPAHVDQLQFDPLLAPERERHLPAFGNEDDRAHLRRRRERAGEVVAERCRIVGIDGAGLELPAQVLEHVLGRVEVMLDARDHDADGRFRLLAQELDRVAPRAPQPEREHDDDSQKHQAAETEQQAARYPDLERARRHGCRRRLDRIESVHRAPFANAAPARFIR